MIKDAAKIWFYTVTVKSCLLPGHAWAEQRRYGCLDLLFEEREDQAAAYRRLPHEARADAFAVRHLRALYRRPWWWVLATTVLRFGV